MTPSTSHDEQWRSVPERLYVQAAARLEVDPDTVQAAMDDLDATVRRRAERRRADTCRLVAELYACEGLDPAPERIDAEADAACAQERDERLAAELRRLVTPGVAAVRRARTVDDRELNGDCQAALNVLATAPRSLAEFQPEAERAYAAERAFLDAYAAQETTAASQLEEAPGWQLRRRRRLCCELADAGRGCTTVENRFRAVAARLVVIELRQAHRTEWLARPGVGEVLGAGAAALRELADRAQTPDGAATVELPAVDQPEARGAAR